MINLFRFMYTGDEAVVEYDKLPCLLHLSLELKVEMGGGRGGKEEKNGKRGKIGKKGRGEGRGKGREERKDEKKGG